MKFYHNGAALVNAPTGILSGANKLLRNPFDNWPMLMYNPFRESEMEEYVPVAQLDRVLDSDSKGRRFESCRAYQNPLIFLKINGFCAEKVKSHFYA